MRALEPLCTLLITVEGYGALEDTPALYLLELLNEEFLLHFLQTNSFLNLDEGFDVLAKLMASSLQVFLNHKVTRIVRGNNYQTIYFNSDFNYGQRQSVRCRKTILAFPPLLPNLISMIPDLSDKEKAVLSQVYIHKYVSAAHYIPSLDHKIYSEAFTQSDVNQLPILTPPLGHGEVVGLVEQSTRVINLKNTLQEI